MSYPKVGLLGGSFNPAHAGHLYISQQALELLGLDEVWWLVSPQNPLKDTAEMAPFFLRLEKAKEVADGCAKIIISDFESHANTTYTYDMLVKLQEHFQGHSFVWLMGADNLLQFSKWHKWRDIMKLLPIAVFNRDGCKKEALQSEAATQFAWARQMDLEKFKSCALPAWVFLDIKTHPLSATKIRNCK